MAKRPSVMYGPITFAEYRAETARAVYWSRQDGDIFETVKLGLGLTVKVKYPKPMMRDKGLVAPVEEASTFLAASIRRRMVTGEWVQGPARPYSLPKGKVWIQPAEASRLADVEGLDRITSGRFAGWAVARTVKAYRDAGGAQKVGSIKFVATGELWFERLTVQMRGPAKSKIWFAGSHRTSGLRDRRADALAERLGKVNRSGLLAVAPGELKQINDLVRKSFTAQIAGEVQLGQQVYDLRSRVASTQRRVSKLLGG